MLAQEVLAEHDLRHVHRVLRALRPEERAHEGAVGVADVVVEHVEVARGGGDVDRLADDAPGVVQVGDRVVDPHQLAEVVEGGVAPPRIEVVHEGRTPRGAEHGVAAADGDGVHGVARMLRELARGAGPDDPAAHPGLEAHPLAVHAGARVAEDREDLGVAAKLHPDVPEQAVGVALDEIEALLVEDVEWAERAADAGGAGSGAVAARFHAGGPPATLGGFLIAAGVIPSTFSMLSVADFALPSHRGGSASTRAGCRRPRMGHFQRANSPILSRLRRRCVRLNGEQHHVLLVAAEQQRAQSLSRRSRALSTETASFAQ